MFKHFYAVPLAALTIAIAAPAQAAAMSASEFTATFNASLDATVSACVNAPDRMTAKEELVPICLNAASHAKALAARAANPATAGVYHIVEYFSLTMAAGAMTRADGVRSHRACQTVARGHAAVTSVDLTLYDPETIGQLRSAFDGDSKVYLLCHSEFPDV